MSDHRYDYEQGYRDRRGDTHDEPSFVLDRHFLAHEAREGLKTFFAPFTGVYRAATKRDG